MTNSFDKVEKAIPTMCINCSTVCGIIAKVKAGKVVKIEGNPKDPNSRGHLCAKGHAAINMLYDPDRILHPMKRMGKRGEGKWQRISWDEALDEVADKLKAIRERGQPERLVLQYGRDRTNGILERFTDAFGTPNKVGHRGLCSLNKRMAIKGFLGDSDWDTNDVAHTRYMLNFGSNLYEAHQGHVPFLQRLVEGRINNGAKLVTFDVRLSNTAARSDEWLPLFPGTDGLVALAMGNVIMEEGLHDREFLDTWTNFPSNELEMYLKPFTLKWAEQESGIAVADIRRIAIEFAKAAPFCTTISNRGSHAHVNGFYNEWAIILLNAIVGSVGKRGGWCYEAGNIDPKQFQQPLPHPPKPQMNTELSHPSIFPLANELYPRAVSTTIYPYIQSGKAKVEALITYYVNAPMSWPEGPTRVQDIYLDENLIPYHVAIDAFYSESAHLADLILPDATFLEKWDLDTRNSYELIPYIGLRQPVVKPIGESKDIRETLRELACRIGGGMEQYFAYQSAEQYVREWAQNIPGGLDQLQRDGVYWDKEAVPLYETYKRKLNEDELRNCAIDQVTNVIYKMSPAGKRAAIGVIVDNIAYQGFATPSRKLQIYSPMIQKLNEQRGKNDSPLPTYMVIRDHHALADDSFVLTTFKWNVHTQSRTMNQVWLAEIVYDNPVWINPSAAKKLKLKNGDWAEITSIRLSTPADQAEMQSSEVGHLKAKVQLTEGIHPKVIAISASLGHWKYGSIAAGRGYNPNPLISSMADPVGGGQSWNDTVVKIKRISEG